MAYSSIVEMTASQALQARCAACAADEGYVGDPLVWARENIWTLAATPGWAPAWDSARASSSENYNPNTGARDDVITDGMILSAVQPLIATPAEAEA